MSSESEDTGSNKKMNIHTDPNKLGQSSDGRSCDHLVGSSATSDDEVMYRLEPDNKRKYYAALAIAPFDRSRLPLWCC